MLNRENQNQQQYIAVKKANGETIYVRDIQIKLMEILREFDRICVEHEIDYILAFGSMLGAIRHQGFIPWDDDLDVLLDRKNYKKLLTVLDHEIGDNFYYHCFEKNSRYNVTLPAMKFRIKNTYIKERNFLLNHGCEGDGLFLDVFVFEKISENKLTHFFHKSAAFLLMLPIVLFENLKIHPLPLKKLLYNYANWYGKANQDSSDAYLPLTWTFDSFKSRLKYDDLYPIIRVQFEDGEYPVPNNYQAFLIATYGENYLTPVPPKQRIAKHTKEVNLNSSQPES